MASNSIHQEVLRRHALPEVLFSDDISFVLAIPFADADAGARAGRFGSEFYVAGRVAVLRQDFLETLTLLGEGPTPEAREALDVEGRHARPGRSGDHVR